MRLQTEREAPLSAGVRLRIMVAALRALMNEIDYLELLVKLKKKREKEKKKNTNVNQVTNHDSGD